MKKLFPLIMVFIMISFFSFGQDKDLSMQASSQKTDKSQIFRQNDFYAGYGAFSVFYFTTVNSGDFDNISTNNLKDPTSPGTFFMGYQRYLNKVIATGFMFGYQPFHRTGYGYDNSYGYYGNNYVPITLDNHLIMGMARVTFSYLNKPVISMYSGIGIGVTINLIHIEGEGISANDRKLLPAGQLTLMGLRFGRAFGGFVEFGFGTYGIVNLGLNYKFAD
jgi:hypothetical protein